MNPKTRNIFIASGIIVGAISAYLLYKYYGKGSKNGDPESGENPVDESKVTANAKSNRLIVSR